jgi:xylan 1,4-beta-xylosidase
LRADWQRQLAYAKEKCGFDYIRMHGLLCDDMGVYIEDNGKPVYSWQYIDELFDFLLSIDVKPFVEIGFMPAALASGEKTIFWWRGNVTPPKDYQKWSDLNNALIRHWVERYGINEVVTWYFEVWNEPNLDGFWTGGQMEYFKLYRETALTIKDISPEFRVGGPATAGAAWVPEFIQFCAETNTPLDFVTTHAYGVDVGFLDEFGSRGTVLSSNPDAIVGDVARVRHEIDTSPMPGLPLHFTEWSASYTPADPVHDSYVEAPYILDKLKNTIELAASMSYWTFTDIFEEAGPRMTPFHGGFGMLNYQSIEKPAFRAYQYLNMLGPTHLSCDDPMSIATKDDHGGVQALFWDLTINQPDGMNNQQYYISDIQPSPAARVDVRIANIVAGRYRLAVYRIGHRINDPFADYSDFGRPAQLTRAQVASIRTRNNGEPVLTEVVDVRSDEELTRSYELRENDVYLLCVTNIA